MIRVILKLCKSFFFFFFSKILKQGETISKEIVYYIDLAYLPCLLAKIYCVGKLWMGGEKKKGRGLTDRICSIIIWEILTNVQAWGWIFAYVLTQCYGFSTVLSSSRESLWLWRGKHSLPLCVKRSGVYPPYR